MTGFSLMTNEISYVVVSPLDLKKGRIYTENIHLKTEYGKQLLLDKHLLDRGEDPLAKDQL